ncbi:hypothetical protein LMG26686_02805 [Achromobacter mucicolens]|uniref:hypothetical protein n=1 Tax=Achromobacter mucicolens TaxID=1389922 RepID=UPI0014696CCE|nr:hypothetical protein [Achromobacter mucicolens]CAB3867904.1 hypothetical protein LMG26686_02805 [Achromobacter mucicolens]
MAKAWAERNIASGAKGLGYVALVVVAMLVGAVLGNRWNSGEAAAWVQAIGSILAILGVFAAAFLQGAQQNRLLQDAKHREDVEASKLVVALAEDAIFAIRDASRSIAAHKGGGKPFSAETDRLDRAEAAMMAVLPTRVPVRMVSDVIVFQRLLTYSLRALRQREGSTEDFKTKTLTSAEDRLTEAQTRLANLKILQDEFENAGKSPTL